jgi:hypothetical protein
MSQFDHGDLPPELSDVADQLRSHRYEASPLELDQTKTRILKRGGGRRVARGGVMRKRTLITALIMFAAIGTGSAGAFSLGGGFFPSFHFPVFHLGGHKAPPTTGGPSSPTTPVGTKTPAGPITAAPSASCAMYGCATSTSIACSPVVLVIFHIAIFPARCTVTVTNLTNGTTPTGTVTVTASGAPTQTCTLSGSGPKASCSVSFGNFAPSNLVHGPVSIGLFSLVTANYSGGSGLSPSSGSTRIIVSVMLF